MTAFDATTIWTGAERVGINPAMPLFQATSIRFQFDEADGGRVIAGACSAEFDEFFRLLPRFLPQALIATEEGEVPAETLRPGVRLLTRDHGRQPLRWIGLREFDWRALGLNPLLRPLRLDPGVSGQARGGLASPGQRLMLPGRGTVLAGTLAGQPGVDRADCTSVRYLHLVLDRAEWLQADGCWSESASPGDPDLIACPVSPFAQG